MKTIILNKKLISTENILSASIDMKEYSIKIVYCFNGNILKESINYNDVHYDPNAEKQQIDLDYEELQRVINGYDSTEVAKLKEEIQDLKVEISYYDDLNRRLNLRFDEIEDVVYSTKSNRKKVDEIDKLLFRMERK